MTRILEGSPEVLKLMHHNPFPNASPRYLRAMLYQYHFTTPPERKSTGNWWSRELKGEYVPTVSLGNLSEIKESVSRFQISGLAQRCQLMPLLACHRLSATRCVGAGFLCELELQRHNSVTTSLPCQAD
jgi:hypothetical protein